MIAKPFLELSGISIRIGSRLVFSNSSWFFARNQNWVLIGPNGSGKSLLARSIAGEFPVVKGEIKYGFRTPMGKIPEDLIALVSFEKQKALAGDASPAIRWFSVEQDAAPTVKHFLSQDSVEEKNPFEIVTRNPNSGRLYARRLRQIVSMLEIKPLLGCTIPALSNGEARKILIARALLKRPRLLILDDAFSGLDSHFRKHLKRILERLMSREVVRILLISSGLGGLPRGITHVLSVNRCRIAAQMSLSEIVRGQRSGELHRTAYPVSTRTEFPLVLKKRRTSAPIRLVEMKNVRVRYSKRTILSDITWNILRGESWALIGPNGSGKSTILSLIDGDNPQAYANSICLFGRRRGSGESIWDLKGRIGRVSPELHLRFPESQTCLETVLSGFQDSMGYQRKTTARNRKIAHHLLSYFGISSWENASFGSMSTGFQRLALLARALVKSPDLLLLDEPCQGLDAQHRNRFISIIESILRHSETTLIYVTHVANEIPRGIGKVLQLRAGQIIRSGSMAGNRGMHLERII